MYTIVFTIIIMLLLLTLLLLLLFEEGTLVAVGGIGVAVASSTSGVAVGTGVLGGVGVRVKRGTVWISGVGVPFCA